MIDEVQFDETRWRNFWTYYKGLTHQIKALEILRQHILKADPCLLTDGAEWVEQFRTPVETQESYAQTISAAGIQLIKDFEGLQLTSYYCPSGVLTIGYGSTGQHVFPGQTITEKEADKLLRLDLERFEDAVRGLTAVELTQGEFDALVSFCFNCGVGAYEHSTLRRRLNAGDDKPYVFRQEFPKWVNGANGPLPGLVRRRDAEVQLATAS